MPLAKTTEGSSQPKTAPRQTKSATNSPGLRRNDAPPAQKDAKLPAELRSADHHSAVVLATPRSPPKLTGAAEEAKAAKLAARLRGLRVEDVPSIPNLNIPTLGRITAVHDADTITVIICLGRSPLCVRVRIAHIDAPEVSLRNGTTPLEKEAGLKVKAYVAGLLTRGETVALVTVILTGLDKYGGRYLGDIILSDGALLSEHLLSRRLVRAYEGERKIPWDVAGLNAIVATLSSF